MAALLLGMALQGFRIDLELRGVPLLEASDRASWAFGHMSDWVGPSQASTRVDLSLRGAGYLETLDTLGRLAGYGPVESPGHPILNRGEIPEHPERGSQLLLSHDLSPWLRLLAIREYYTRERIRLRLVLIGEPASPEEPPRFKGKLNGRVFQADFVPRERGPGPRVWTHEATMPYTRSGEWLELWGELFSSSCRQWLVMASSQIPPHEDFPDDVKLPLWPLLAAGLIAVAVLVFLGIRAL